MLHFCTDTFIVCTLSYIFFFIIYVYVYSGLKMFRRELYTVLLLLFCLAGYPQTGIRLDHRSKPGKSSLLRPEKTVTVRTFGGLKLSGPAFFQPDGRLVVSGKELNPDDVMMISGFVKRNPREKAGGLGLTIGAGAVFPVALLHPGRHCLGNAGRDICRIDRAGLRSVPCLYGNQPDGDLPQKVQHPELEDRTLCNTRRGKWSGSHPLPHRLT